MTEPPLAEVDIDGYRLDFRHWPNGADYEIDSTDIGEVKVWTCLKSLEEHFERNTIDSSHQLELDLWIELDPDRLFQWEINVLGIGITHLSDKTYRAEFSLNTAIGTHQHALKEAVSSIIHGTDFALYDLKGTNEFPTIEEGAWHQWVCWVTGFAGNTKFNDLFALRDRISQAVFLLQDVISTPYLALRMIQLGQAQALLGLQETEWLEVKSSAYELKNIDEIIWKHELAEDVAQFANTDIGGLLLIGFRTKRKSGVDTIEKITPAPLNEKRLQIYRDVLRRKIHPPISQLLIEAVPWGAGQLICIFVPPQRYEQQPYLVSGTTMHGRYVRSGVTIVRRQGDASIPITAEEIHSTLVAGRAFLRGNRQTGVS